jgi:hypothetical protein
MIKVDSLSKFIAAVDKIQTKWTNECGEYISPWFRGHSNAEFNLLPSILRENLLPNEDSYRHDFQLKSYPFLTDTFGVPQNNWEWYFIMQHYGLPTRLLDWTEGSLIALYFALFYKTDESNPCVWVLHPFEFNKFFKKTAALLSTEDELKGYLPEIWTKTKLPKYPAALQPIYKSKRIIAQKGCFTIHGEKAINIENIEGLKGYLIKIEIDFYQVDLIKGELNTAGITESTLFPELSGLARELKLYYTGHN